MVWSYRKNARNKNGQSNTSLETISKRPTGRSKIRWEDDVKKNIERLKVPNWKTFVQDREDGRKWLGRPKLCTKSCKAVLRRKDYNTYHCVTVVYSIQYSNMLYRIVA